MFYYHDSPFQVIVLSSYPSNWFLLSRRGTERDKGDCPVSIQSLCTLHNAIASFRFQISVNSDLTKDGGFKALQPNWILYQKKHAARCESMKKAHRIDPVIAGREIVNLPSACALRGTQKDLTVGGKDDICSKFTCSLRPERDNASPPSKFSDLYSKRSTIYNETRLNKISEDQLINFQLLVRMEIQFLSGYDVEWHPSIGNPAEGGGFPTGGPCVFRSPRRGKSTHRCQTLGVAEYFPDRDAFTSATKTVGECCRFYCQCRRSTFKLCTA